MPLNYQLEKCKDWESLTTDTEWGKTQNIIFLTMAVGIPEISDKETAAEFLARDTILCRVCEGKWESSFTLEDIEKRIGLYTNASRLTEKEFLKAVTEKIKQQLCEYRRRSKICVVA